MRRLISAAFPAKHRKILKVGSVIICAVAGAYALLIGMAGWRLLVSPPQVAHNEALNAKSEAGPKYQPSAWLETRKTLPEHGIVLAFSGGGIRAAAFSAGVLAQFGRAGYADRLMLVSSVSGGSTTAAFYAAHGMEGFTSADDGIGSRFYADFLTRENNSALFARLANPVFLTRLALGVEGTSGVLKSYFADTLGLGAATFESVSKGWADRAFVMLNATDIVSNQLFPFSQGVFVHLCSDLRKFPFAEAVAASAAFPVLTTPVKLANFHSSCDRRPDAEARLEILKPCRDRRVTSGCLVDANDAELLSIVRYMELLSTGKVRPALSDGGIADNLGLSSVRSVADPALLMRLHARGLRNLLFVAVDSRGTPQRPDQINWITALAEDAVDRISAFSSTAVWAHFQQQINALNMMAQSGADFCATQADQDECFSTISSDAFPRDPEAARLFREAVKQVQPSKCENGCKTNRNPLPLFKFYPVTISFNHEEDLETRDRLRNIPTTWSIPQADIDLLIRRGADLLRTDRCFGRWVDADVGGCANDDSEGDPTDHISRVGRQTLSPFIINAE